jgi:hypothetical protein
VTPDPSTAISGAGSSVLLPIGIYDRGRTRAGNDILESAAERHAQTRLACGLPAAAHRRGGGDLAQPDSMRGVPTSGTTQLIDDFEMAIDGTRLTYSRPVR